MEHKTTDGDIVRICRLIDEHNQAVWDLIDSIEASNHPNAADIKQALEEECLALSWATHVVSGYLEHKDQWETGNWGIRHIVAHKALTRRHENRISVLRRRE